MDAKIAGTLCILMLINWSKRRVIFFHFQISQANLWDQGIYRFYCDKQLHMVFYIEIIIQILFKILTEMNTFNKVSQIITNSLVPDKFVRHSLGS